jgi:hypothetical protein
MTLEKLAEKLTGCNDTLYIEGKLLQQRALAYGDGYSDGYARALSDIRKKLVDLASRSTDTTR